MTKIGGDPPDQPLIPPLKETRRTENAPKRKSPDEGQTGPGEEEEYVVPGPEAAGGPPLRAITPPYRVPPSIAAARFLPQIDATHLLPPATELLQLPEATEKPSDLPSAEKILEIEQGKTETAESAGGPPLTPIQELAKRRYSSPDAPKTGPDPEPDKPKEGGRGR